MKRLLIICCAIFAYVSASAVEFIYNGPYLQSVTDNAAYIVWLTDKASEGWVEIKGAGLKATYVESQNGVKWVRRDHRIAVTGLKAGQQYEYKVYSKDPKTGKVISLATNTKGEKLTFKTLGLWLPISTTTSIFQTSSSESLRQSVWRARTS